MANELPNTESATITRMAIAWNIVLNAGYNGDATLDRGEQRRQAMTQAFIETYNALLQNERDNSKSVKAVSR